MKGIIAVGLLAAVVGRNLSAQAVAPTQTPQGALCDYLNVVDIPASFNVRIVSADCTGDAKEQEWNATVDAVGRSLTSSDPVQALKLFGDLGRNVPEDANANRLEYRVTSTPDLVHQRRTDKSFSMGDRDEVTTATFFLKYQVSENRSMLLVNPPERIRLWSPSVIINPAPSPGVARKELCDWEWKELPGTAGHVVSKEGIDTTYLIRVDKTSALVAVLYPQGSWSAVSLILGPIGPDSGTLWLRSATRADGSKKHRSVNVMTVTDPNLGRVDAAGLIIMSREDRILDQRESKVRPLDVDHLPEPIRKLIAVEEPRK